MIRFSPTARKIDNGRKLKNSYCPKTLSRIDSKLTPSHTHIYYICTHTLTHTCTYVYIHVCIPVNSTSPRPTQDYGVCVHGRCYCSDIRMSHYARWLRIVSNMDNEILHLKSNVCFAKSNRKNGESSDKGHETQLIIALLLLVKPHSRLILTYIVSETSKCAFALLV